MSFSNYLELKFLDLAWGAVAFTAPVTVYAALYTAAPSDSGGGTEATGGAYARVAITNNATNWPAAASGAKSNGTVITFPTATANWGTVTHFGVFDAATAGNLLNWGALTTSQAVNTGATPSFAAGALSITLD